MQLIPVCGDQVGGIDVRPTMANRSDHFRRQLAVGDRKRDTEVIGFDLSARLRGSSLDRLASRSRLVRSQEAAHQPSASVPMRRNAAGAEPPSQMSSGGSGRGATAAAVTVKYRPL